MAKSNKHNSKSVSIARIVIELLKETFTFLCALAIGILDIVTAIFK